MKLPKGYRLLKSGEVIKNTDICLKYSENKWVQEDSYGVSQHGSRWGKNFIPYARAVIQTPKGWNVTFATRKQARVAVDILTGGGFDCEFTVLKGPHKA